MSDKTLKLLNNKINNQQSEKPIKQKKIFSNHISNEELTSIIYKELLQLNNKNPTHF